jgi:hypothetical protein
LMSIEKNEDYRGGIEMEFSERTIKVIIDEAKCEGCATHACIKGWETRC